MFALLRQSPDGTVPSHSQLLLRALATMAQHEGPAAFFDFASETAGLMRTSSMRFPGAASALLPSSIFQLSWLWGLLPTLVFGLSKAPQSGLASLSHELLSTCGPQSGSECQAAFTVISEPWEPHTEVCTSQLHHLYSCFARLFEFLVGVTMQQDDAAFELTQHRCAQQFRRP